MDTNDTNAIHGDRSDVADAIAFSELDRSCKIPRVKADAHLRKVQDLITEMAVQRKLNVDVCRTAAIMHDLWLYRNREYTPEIVAEHGPRGAELAKRLLFPTKLYSEDELSTILRMIDRHDFLDALDDPYCEALKDADCLANGKERAQ